ncbi:hypothetical protein K435DRAFT_854495 [Dendrothele bispora CBS 962.96]|uniref:GDP/GTP exchange factor Sec2 N-terminal domain-containing protein n=1 Tax=Dendrothele bispora (strain CBS 962.96) TaxID=1314807 RepID=A0A4V4HGZ1_DENBC|nr:hypothetical protein K435DRAFT_854495 [Dendrothele bispora CBS 962.96]
MAQVDHDEQSNNDEQKPSVNGDSSSMKAHHPSGSESEDPQVMLIASLRSQIQDLFSQVTQLNGKLVKSYDRVSDLEDDLHVASANLRQSSLKVSQLELERTQHLSALNTGLLVEKSQVTSELTRLMEKATEEAAQRGQAESARAAIEKDLDDLSANLFDQANTMVAEARYGRFLSEEKLKSAEEALKGAEEAVTMMQQQMQVMQGEKEEAEKSMQEMNTTMGKGKWVERQDVGPSTRIVRLLSSHTPYQEFLLFIAHLRSLHPASPQSPAMATLLPLPFLARLMTEDSDPTIRLDLAPALNWLSRRSVLSALHNGQLTIEPMASSILLQESIASPTSIPGLNNNNSVVSCALCGVPIFSNSGPQNTPSIRPPVHPAIAPNGNSWSTSLFKRQRTTSATSRPPSPPPRSKSRPRAGSVPEQVYIFRISGTGVTAYPSLPNISTTSFTPASFTSNIGSSAPSQPPSHPTHNGTNSTSSQSSTIYPLCPNGWCLARLRATCSLWAFVRNGIVEKVWEEEVPNLPSPSAPSANGTDKPPVPPRRRGLWGMATALGERAASWSESDKEKGKKPLLSDSKSQPPTPEKKLPTTPTPRPPPMHPAVAAASTPAPAPASSIPEPPVGATATPPPLPRRNEGRNRPTPTTPTAKAVNGDSIFSSPTDDAKPASPTHVPLPESRPATPSTPVGTVPSRTASPAPGAPPPLPRRAAGRAPRPTSVLAPKVESLVGEKTSQEGEALTPAPESPEVAKESVAPVSIAETTSGEAVSNNEESPAAGVAEDDSKKDENGNTVPAPSSEGTDAAQPKPEENATEATKSEEPESIANVEQPPQEQAAETESKGAAALVFDAGEDHGIPDVTKDETNLEQPNEEESKKLEAAEVVSNGTDGDLHHEINGFVEQEKDKEKDKETSEVYIGDATWEERTWKEVIRLKEVMFWARVGGIRTDD